MRLAQGTYVINKCYRDDGGDSYQRDRDGGC